VAHWRWRTAGRGWEVGQEVEEGVLYSRNARGPSGLAALDAASDARVCRESYIRAGRQQPAACGEHADGTSRVGPCLHVVVRVMW
jgi:hypothetical protein